jgi:hypothetical protein
MTDDRDQAIHFGKIGLCIGIIMLIAGVFFMVSNLVESGALGNEADCTFLTYEKYNISVVPDAVIDWHRQVREKNMTGVAAECRRGVIAGGIVIVNHMDQDRDPLDLMKNGGMVDKNLALNIVVTDNSSSFCGYPAYAGYIDTDEKREYFRVFKPEPYSFGLIESMNIEFFDVVRIDPA